MSTPPSAVPAAGNRRAWAMVAPRRAGPRHQSAPEMLAARSRCRRWVRSAVVGLNFAGASASVTICSARSIALCLKPEGERAGAALTLHDCVDAPTQDAQWDAWGWHPGAGDRAEGALCVQGARCLSENLTLGTTDERWSWDAATLHLRHGGRCLSVEDGAAAYGALRRAAAPPRLRLAACVERVRRADERGGGEQNGWGSAAQTWVLMPVRRPQLEILDKIALPLRTHGRYLTDQNGLNIKLVGVNWFGAHLEQLVNNGLDRSSPARIAALIKHMGFNSVRLGYALTMTDTRSTAGQYPKVPDPRLVAGSPELRGLTALEVFDRCVEALTRIGLLVVITSHVSSAGWCCTPHDGNSLWYNQQYSTEDWLRSLELIAARYKGNARVIGVDIRNEPRMDDDKHEMAWWGVWEPAAFLIPGYTFKDWRVAAAQGAVATWKGNPDILVIIEGISFAMHLGFVMSRKLKLAQRCLFSRVVYENHDYPHFRFHLFDWVNDRWPFTVLSDIASAGGGGRADNGTLKEVNTSYKRFKEARSNSFFYLHEQNLAPVWGGEFGFDDRSSPWWRNVLRLYKESDASWCYWGLDPIKYPAGFKESYRGGLNDTFGLFDHWYADYEAVVGWKLQDLITAQAPRPDSPASLPRPRACRFEAEANELYAREPTTFREIMMTTPRNLWYITLVLLVCSCSCICRILLRTTRKPADRSWHDKACMLGDEGTAPE